MQRRGYSMIAALLCTIALAGPHVQAQDARGKLLGRITDPSGTETF